MNLLYNKSGIKFLLSFIFLLFFATIMGQNSSSELSFNRNISEKKPPKQIEELLKQAEKEQNSVIKLEYYEELLILQIQ